MELAKEILIKIQKEIEEALRSNYNIIHTLEDSPELYHNVQGKINALSSLEYFIEELYEEYIIRNSENFVYRDDDSIELVGVKTDG